MTSKQPIPASNVGNPAVRIPDYILPTSIERFIKRYFDNNNVQKPRSGQDIAELYKNLVSEKITDYYNANPNAKYTPKSIEYLDFSEVSVVLMCLFQFKNIQMSETSKQHVLGVYIEEPHESAGIYATDNLMIKRLIEPFGPKFKDSDFEEVIKKIERNVPVVNRTTDKHLVPVKNGVFNKKTKQLEAFTSDYVFTNKIPHPYNEHAKNPIIIMPDGLEWDVENWIKSLMANDEEVKLLWEVIADTLQPNFTRRKSIWFYSQAGNNGKGTYGQLIKNILGSGNYASLSVSDFNHEYLKEQLIDVSANISDENDANVYIDSVKDYKASITGDDIVINRKYEKPVNIKFYGTNIQMLNGLPKTSDRSGSLYRRLVIVPFLKSFTNNGERPYIRNDYMYRDDVIQYVLKKALHIDFDEFTVPKTSAELLEEYREGNNPVQQYWNEFKDEFAWDLLPTQFLYDLYLSWFQQVNPRGKPLSRHNFIEDLLPLATDFEDKTRQKDKVRSNNKMDDDEPLITEYNLLQWTNPNNKGKSLKQYRDFKRKATYRGLLRK